MHCALLAMDLKHFTNISIFKNLCLGLGFVLRFLSVMFDVCPP